MNLWKFFERDRKPHESPEWMKEVWRAAGWKDEADLAKLRTWREQAESHNGRAAAPLTTEQMRAAFAVPNDQLQWRATHQALDAEIQVCLRAAVDLTMQPPACACEVAAIEHLERLKRTLEELREYGLKSPGA